MTIWHYEVTCLRKEECSKEIILNAIRRSLKGEPATIMRHLDSIDNIDEILRYRWEVRQYIWQCTKDIPAELYNAKQKGTEDCVTWSIRLGDLKNRAISKSKVSAVETKEMLRTMFYKVLDKIYVTYEDIFFSLFLTFTSCALMFAN